MASSFTSTEKTARQDTFKVSPADVKRGRNSRLIGSPDYAKKVADLAYSIYTNGQIAPSEVRKDDEKALVLSSGFTRADAVELIRKGFKYVDVTSGVETEIRDPEFKLWVAIRDVTADEAFLRGLRENLDRNDTTDLQEALAQQELRTAYGWTETQIARFYGYTNQNRVATLCKLLALPEDVQQKVHRGELALHAAVLCKDHGLSAEETAAVIDGATSGKGKVEGNVLKKLIRDLLDKKDADAVAAAEAARAAVPVVTDDTERPGEEKVTATVTSDESEKVKKIKRTAKEFQNFAAEIVEREGVDERLQDLFAALTNWIDGKKGFGNQAILNRLFRIQDSLKEKEAE